ncbi:hypothetical protein LCM00_15780, partial [Bacillus infantis]|uniref:hypothetical protein n=1 Tax=Bacillus infantis TaxID=324767 RepID=UPI001CD3C07A
TARLEIITNNHFIKLSRRRIPNGTYGAVRGRHGDVPPTRLSIKLRRKEKKAFRPEEEQNPFS